MGQVAGLWGQSSVAAARIGMPKADKFIASIATASLDALGLMAQLEADPTAQQSADTCEALFGQVLDAQDAYESPDPRSKRTKLFSANTYMGDSIYVFGTDNTDIDRQVKHLTALVAALLWVGVRSQLKGLSKAFTPRAGIGAGSLRVRSFRASGQLHVFPIGTSMAYAHAAERAQDWVGGAIASHLALDDDPYCVSYPIPLRHGMQSGALSAIDWFRIARQNRADYSPEQLLSDLAAHAERQETPEARRKWQHTLSFAERMAVLGGT